MENEEAKNNEADASPVQPKTSAHVVTAEAGLAQDVPTIPIGSLEMINELQPEVSVHSISSTRAVSVPAPLVVHETEYRRNIGDLLQLWWDGIRPAYLSLSLVPLFVGSALAWTQTITTRTPLGHFHFTHFAGSILALLCLQLGANLVNDYYDYLRGIDRSNMLGPGGLIQQGQFRPTRILMIGLVLLLLGALVGLAVALAGGPLIYLFGLVGVLCAYFYSATARALSSLALSELIAFIVFGPLITLGAYMVQTAGTLSRTAFIYSIPLGLLAAAVIHVNNMRDIEGDAQAGKHTIATVLGLQWSKAWFMVLLLGAYVVVTVLGISHAAPHWLLITLWTLPMLLIIVTGVLRTDTPVGFHQAMRQLLKLEAFFGLLLIIALFLPAIVALFPHIPVVHLLPA
jgi:1,4-dihydroxy-2-naphthoate polyprenyltransferase